MKIKANQSIIAGVIAFLVASSCCWLPALAIAIGGASSMMALSSSLEKFSGLFMVMGSILLVYGGYQLFNKNKTMKEVILKSTITCPDCGFAQTENMPTNACQFFYDCKNCKKTLKPKQGDCCVYCSYGSVACPPIQEGKNCC